MKKIFVLILVLLFCLCGCKGVKKTDTPDSEQKQVIVFPSEQTAATLNGYKAETTENGTQNKIEYIGNSNSKKFHVSGCPYIKNIKTENIVKSFNRTQMINDGYAPCQSCKP